jgi:hypothetical protein
VSVLYNKVVSECLYSTTRLYPSVCIVQQGCIRVSVLYNKVVSECLYIQPYCTIQTLGYNLIVQYRHSDTTLLYYTDTQIQPCCIIQTLRYNLIVLYRHSDTTLLYYTDTRIQLCTTRLYPSVCIIQ